MSAKRAKKPEKASTSGPRLPRETGALIAPLGDGLTILERAMAALGDRVRETKTCFLLDGKPCNTKDILKAAGMKFADE
ncbi:hypothetical protein D869_gp322 [Caulobacter phage CcrRogue]|uniref:Uncharacterized protein n=1 Tax=Caulobacter phage CcrRogue TaxID=2927986 RepID=K4K307_9CAUD|nr:hypothetical protein D869_gp322 [Caulobacter phage CcrRogue]AFU86592.1 hypothetical protein CcrRogue_gp110 [Caulobacter phage CcrRogue]